MPVLISRVPALAFLSRRFERTHVPHYTLVGLLRKYREEDEVEEAAKITGLGPNGRTGKLVGRRFDNQAMEKMLCYKI